MNSRIQREAPFPYSVTVLCPGDKAVRVDVGIKSCSLCHAYHEYNRHGSFFNPSSLTVRDYTVASVVYSADGFHVYAEEYSFVAVFTCIQQCTGVYSVLIDNTPRNGIFFML